MWTDADILAEYEIDGPVVSITLSTPVGVVSGLNAIGRKLLEIANVEKIVIQGSARTTGRRKGAVPRNIPFPRA